MTSTTPRPLSQLRSQRGVSLLEVLIAVLVLSIGLLGMAALQGRAMQGNHSSSLRTQAVMMSYYILDSLRADPVGARALSYNTAGMACTASNFSDETLPHNTLEHWIGTLHAVLLDTDSTCGSVNCTIDGVCTVQVQWDDSRAGGLGTQTITTSSRL